MLRYNRLHHSVSDKIQAGTILRIVNWYAQVYSTEFGSSTAHIMKRKGDAHGTLSLLFNRDDVPPNMVMDGSKEQTVGFFSNKFQEADCHINQTKPYYPWQLQAEGTTRELKKGAGRNMVWAGSPKRIWDDAMEFESYVRSNASLDIYML